jgi:ATP-dependent DNA helicase PIF1
MANKICFEALDRTLRDILRHKNDNTREKPFGAMTVVLGEDFRQILPVQPKRRRHNIVTTSIKRSYLWKHFHILTLTKNMRLNSITDDVTEKQKVAEFAEWILDIGNGKNTSAEGDQLIKMPSEILLKKGNDPKKGNCRKHISKFEGDVPRTGIFRRKNNLMSKERNSPRDK